jgi:hypothetical protein
MIRHGEKPPKDSEGNDLPSLSTEGIARAQGLVHTFGASSQYDIGFILVEHPKKSAPP